MANYVKKNWAYGDVFTPEAMNNIENGIKSANDDANTANQSISTINGKIGTSDITSIGDGTITGAISSVNSKADTAINGLAATTPIHKFVVRAGNWDDFWSQFSYELFCNTLSGTITSFSGVWEDHYWFYGVSFRYDTYTYAMVHLGNDRVYVMDYRYNQYRYIYRIHNEQVTF